jgi:hypothetical protein
VETCRAPGRQSWPSRIVWAYPIVHHAISALTAKASAAADLDPDRISFTKALRLGGHSPSGLG